MAMVVVNKERFLPTDSFVNAGTDRSLPSAIVATVLLATAVPAAAQHWSFDARRIAIGGAGASNPSSQLVDERRGYGTVPLPFGLLQSLSDLDVYRSLANPAHPAYDPVRALELLLSPLHYTITRPHQPALRDFVRDLANRELSRDFDMYQGIDLPDRIFWEALAAPNWGPTFTLSGDRDGFFHGVYVGAGPYSSVRTDTGIDRDLVETLARFAEADDDLPANLSFDSSHETTIQAAAAVTGGYRARVPIPGGGAYESDGIYIAADYHYLHGLGMAHVAGDLNFTTDEAGLIVGDAGTRQLGFYDAAGSQSGRGFAVDVGATAVIGPVEIGLGARGFGNRMEWTGLEYERDIIEIRTEELGSQPDSGFEGGSELRIELPVHWTADTAYHAIGWSAMAEYGHGLLGHRVRAGVEFRRGWVELRGGGRFLRDRWHPSVGVGLNRSAGPSLDVALFGVSANVARRRSLAIAVSLRLGDDMLSGGS